MLPRPMALLEEAMIPSPPSPCDPTVWELHGGLGRGGRSLNRKFQQNNQFSSSLLMRVIIYRLEYISELNIKNHITVALLPDRKI